MDPWFPWDVTGSGGPGVPDGKVRVDDVANLVNHYRHDNMYFAVPAP